MTFKPTPEHRQQAEVLSGYGVPHEAISTIIGCAPKTLREHFRHELDVGMAKANAKVGQVIFQEAMKGNMTAAIFWAKVRMGWQEVSRNKVEVSGPDGGPVQTEVIRRVIVDPKIENDIEAKKLIERSVLSLEEVRGGFHINDSARSP